MKPETQGKLMVAMLISILAFGLGTVVVLLTGQYNHLDSTITFNTTKQSEMPIIPNTNQRNSNTTTITSNQPNSQNDNDNNNNNQHL